MKEKKDCKIIQDLLPNYIEDLTNQETNKYIEEHLNECNDCKKIFENMKKNLHVNNENKDKKAVKYFKKYKNKLRFLRMILLILLIVFVVNIARKMIIISDLSNKAESNINSTNYHRIMYYYNKDNTAIAEIFALGDKKKIVMTKMSKEGMTINTMYANKTQPDKWGNESYNANSYIITNGNKTALLNHTMGINADPQNSLYTQNLLELLTASIPTSIKSITYNGEECYYITNFNGIYSFASQGMYINKETGLPISMVAYEYKNSDGSQGRWPTVEYVYEFDKVTEADFIEPDISEYEVMQ